MTYYFIPKFGLNEFAHETIFVLSLHHKNLL